MHLWVRRVTTRNPRCGAKLWQRTSGRGACKWVRAADRVTSESRYESFVGKNRQVVVGQLKTTASGLSIASMRSQGDRCWA